MKTILLDEIEYLNTMFPFLDSIKIHIKKKHIKKKSDTTFIDDFSITLKPVENKIIVINKNELLKVIDFGITTKSSNHEQFIIEFINSLVYRLQRIK